MADDEYKVAHVNNIDIVYSTFGVPDAEPVVLIMGLGAQMIDWREEFCTKLADHGYWVIRFDNRDAGLSSKFESAGKPDLFELLMKINQGETVEVPYKIEDMAADTLRLLDYLEIDSAHVVGLSMGGMIAQSVAIESPEKVISLTSIMSSSRYMYPASAEAAALLTQRAAESKEEYIEQSLENSKILGGSKFQHDEDLYRQHAGRKYDRGIYPPGFARQLAAVMVQDDRRNALSKINVPTLVLHGDADPLVPVEGCVETADAVPNSKMKIIEGWGHGFPPVIWPIIIDELVAHFQTAKA